MLACARIDLLVHNRGEYIDLNAKTFGQQRIIVEIALAHQHMILTNRSAESAVLGHSHKRSAYEEVYTSK